MGLLKGIASGLAAFGSHDALKWKNRLAAKEVIDAAVKDLAVRPRPGGADAQKLFAMVDQTNASTGAFAPRAMYENYLKASQDGFDSIRSTQLSPAPGSQAGLGARLAAEALESGGVTPGEKAAIRELTQVQESKGRASWLESSESAPLRAVASAPNAEIVNWLKGLSTKPSISLDDVRPLAQLSFVGEQFKPEVAQWLRRGVMFQDSFLGKPTAPEVRGYLENLGTFALPEAKLSPGAREAVMELRSRMSPESLKRADSLLRSAKD